MAQYLSLTETQNIEDNANTFQKLETKYQTVKKEKENLQLKQDNLEIENKRKQNLNLLIASILTFFLGSIIATLVLKNSKRKTKLAEQENELDISESNLSESKKFLEEVLLHKPLEGVLSDGIDFKSGHYGVDVSAAEGTRVKSILTGTVVFSGFTASGGNEIHIQHDYNLISIYKHNSAVLKSAGDKIISGESVAIVGNSGEHSDGTHLHFEMWQKGTPLNPEDYFSF